MINNIHSINTDYKNKYFNVGLKSAPQQNAKGLKQTVSFKNGEDDDIAKSSWAAIIPVFGTFATLLSLCMAGIGNITGAETMQDKSLEWSAYAGGTTALYLIAMRLFDKEAFFNILRTFSKR